MSFLYFTSNQLPKSKMRRRKHSSTSILHDPHSSSDINVDNLYGFLKRKIPALGSLLVGIMVGLLVAHALGANVSVASR